MRPVANEIISRLSAGRKLDQVARDIALRLGVTPGQVLAYVPFCRIDQ